MKKLGLLLTYLLLAPLGPASAQQAAPPPSAASGHLKGVKVMVTDLDRSVRFYSEVFGLKVARKHAETGGEVNEAIMTQDGRFDLGPLPWLVLKVPGPADAAAPRDRSGWGQVVMIRSDGTAIAKRAGVTARTFDHGIVVVSDPDGNQIEVLPAAAGAASGH